jgi:predicted amidohydrolase YtcJ
MSFNATACDLDRIEALRPIALQGNDGHTVFVNSRGLYLLKKIRPIQSTPSPALSPALAFKRWTTARIWSGKSRKNQGDPRRANQEHASLTAAVLKDMSANGITSLMDARVGPDEEDVWRRLYRTGRPDMWPDLRVRMAIVVDEPNATATGGV